MPKMFEEVSAEGRFVKVVTHRDGELLLSSSLLFRSEEDAVAAATWLRAGLVPEPGKTLHQCQFICQGCGTVAGGEYAAHGWHKPRHWFERSDEDGAQTACSRECIKIIAEKTAKTGVILPI